MPETTDQLKQRLDTYMGNLAGCRDRKDPYGLQYWQGRIDELRIRMGDLLRDALPAAPVGTVDPAADYLGLGDEPMEGMKERAVKRWDEAYRSRQENEAIDTVIQLGSQYGYGNLISCLKEAWSQELQEGGMSKNAADRGAFIICVWCGVDERTGEKAP